MGSWGVVPEIETNASLQAKRPIKTVNGFSLEGAGNVTISSFTDEIIVIDFTENARSYQMYAPYNMVISSVVDILNSPVTTIKKNGVAYVLNSSISIGDIILISVSISSVIKLNVVK